MPNLELMFLQNFQKGRALVEQGQYEEALPYLERAYRIKPDDVKLLNTLGAVYFKTHRLDEAEKIYETLAQKHPNIAVLHSNLGMVRIKKQDWEGAEVAFTRVLELDPGNQKAQSYLGLVYERLGDLERALEAYERAGATSAVERVRKRLAERPQPSSAEREETVDEADIVWARPLSEESRPSPTFSPASTMLVPQEQQGLTSETAQPTEANPLDELLQVLQEKPLPIEEASPRRETEATSGDVEPTEAPPSETQPPPSTESPTSPDMTMPGEFPEEAPLPMEVEHTQVMKPALTPRPSESPEVSLTDTIPRPVNLGVYTQEQLYIHPPIGSDRFLILEPHLLEVVLSDRLVFRKGALVGYSGELAFQEADVESGFPLVEAQGRGLMFLTYERRRIQLISLNEEVFYVAASCFLMAQSSLQIRPRRITQDSRCTFSFLEITGTGTVGFVVRSRPLILKVSRHMPAVVHSDAVVAWSGRIQVEPIEDPQTQGLLRSYTESAIPLRFQGVGDLVVEQSALWGDRRVATE